MLDEREPTILTNGYPNPISRLPINGLRKSGKRYANR